MQNISKTVNYKNGWDLKYAWVCACVYHELLTTVPWCTIVRFLFSRYRRWQEIRIESRIAGIGIGIGRENDKVRETLWSGMLLGRGHLICKCTVTAGRLLSLVPNLDLDSKQRGQYFNLHLHLKLFKGWQPPSYSFTSHLSSSFLSPHSTVETILITSPQLHSTTFFPSKMSPNLSLVGIYR